MTLLGVLGEFSQAVLGLTFSCAFALLLAFVCLKLLVGLMTGRQHNAPDPPRHMTDTPQAM